MTKPKPTFGRYTGIIKPETSYICPTDNNILKVESITRPKDVWMVNFRYTYSLTKKDQTVSIVEYDFVKDIENGKFREL